MKKYRAIIVDDERNVREALGILLNELCTEIELCGTAASAAEGRDLLKS
jgi:two-component system LytT family response regulator